MPGSSVVGFPKRLSFLLLLPVSSKAPSLHPHYRTSSLLRASPTPGPRPLPVMYSHKRLPPPACGSWRRVSQVPLLICPCALPPLTPESPATAPTHCFIASVRLHPNPADWPLPSRNEAETGLLMLRLTGLPFEASSQQVTLLQRSIGYMSYGQLHGGLLSSHKISQAWPGAPDARRSTQIQRNRRESAFIRGH